MIAKITALFMTIIMFLFPKLNIPETEKDTQNVNTEYTCVFVHGLSGWGEYSFQNNFLPYWGMFGGDLMDYLNARGFNCCAATVGGSESAWDRACELYAQLTGTRTDYGEAHAKRCNHERYGTDYTGKALIDFFDEVNKINLFGHSFGGATILMFLDIMQDGSAEERAVTPENELSDFFKGEKGDWIYSVTTLAAPLNGTTAYETKTGEIELTFAETVEAALIDLGSTVTDDRIEEDCAEYDMHIDNAQKLLQTFETQSEVYYFSIPCSSCNLKQDGTYEVIEDITETMFLPSAKHMAVMTGVTKGGFVYDEQWLDNDGLVNTVSAKAPMNAPQKDFDKNSIEKGIWNIMPTYRGDHMSLQGGMTVNNDVRELYVDFINMLNSL